MDCIPVHNYSGTHASELVRFHERFLLPDQPASDAIMGYPFTACQNYNLAAASDHIALRDANLTASTDVIELKEIYQIIFDEVEGVAPVRAARLSNCTFRLLPDNDTLWAAVYESEHGTFTVTYDARSHRLVSTFNENEPESQDTARPRDILGYVLRGERRATAAQEPKEEPAGKVLGLPDSGPIPVFNFATPPSDDDHLLFDEHRQVIQLWRGGQGVHVYTEPFHVNKRYNLLEIMRRDALTVSGIVQPNEVVRLYGISAYYTVDDRYEGVVAHTVEGSQFAPLEITDTVHTGTVQLYFTTDYGPLSIRYDPATGELSSSSVSSGSRRLVGFKLDGRMIHPLDLLPPVNEQPKPDQLLVFEGYVQNTKYVRKNVMSVVLEMPAFNSEVVCEAFRSFWEIQPMSINGLKAGFRLHEDAEGVTSMVSLTEDVTLALYEKYGKPIARGFEYWAREFLCGSKEERASRRTGFKVLFFVPDPTYTKVVEAWIGEDLHLHKNDAICEMNHRRDLAAPREGIAPYHITFVGEFDFGPHVVAQAQQAYDRMNLNAMSPAMQQAFVDSIGADLDSDQAGYAAMLERVAKEKID